MFVYRVQIFRTDAKPVMGTYVDWFANTIGLFQSVGLGSSRMFAVKTVNPEQQTQTTG